MGARNVVVLHEFKQDALQVSSTDNEKMIQTFFPDSASPAFSIDICVRCLKKRVNEMKAFGLENGLKCPAKRAVIVMDQEL
jgi:hypothetical protein